MATKKKSKQVPKGKQAEATKWRDLALGYMALLADCKALLADCKRELSMERDRAEALQGMLNKRVDAEIERVLAVKEAKHVLRTLLLKGYKKGRRVFIDIEAFNEPRDQIDQWRYMKWGPNETDRVRITKVLGEFTMAGLAVKSVRGRWTPTHFAVSSGRTCKGLLSKDELAQLELNNLSDALQL